MNDYLGRLKLEEKELQEKLGKLIEFINGDKIKNLSVDNICLLGQQCDLMGKYHKVLVKRIELAEKENK